jgi:hypothetical protein
MPYHPDRQVWSPMTLEDAVKQYLLYKNRVAQLARETRVANRMIREAQEEIERLSDLPEEYLVWDIPSDR